ncbi:hypothetical protein [Vibrio phage vB_VmeM-Yong XC32]|nr:hypothetical protein [Vibrio phage vB_VmeM-Yong XC31]QAX96548.1 hypothetical protein [Vibrio phage vB_VmeM-Yong XC32]QAX96866.1 hypothetical protein [Vibrio phage vB_VmeM-Yong MS31]QAX97171.1 hypothetical protein [Vibrio phage vB_VmeM-Yong MS32]
MSTSIMLDEQSVPEVLRFLSQTNVTVYLQIWQEGTFKIDSLLVFGEWSANLENRTLLRMELHGGRTIKVNPGHIRPLGMYYFKFEGVAEKQWLDFQAGKEFTPIARTAVGLDDYLKGHDLAFAIHDNTFYDGEGCYEENHTVSIFQKETGAGMVVLENGEWERISIPIARHDYKLAKRAIVERLREYVATAKPVEICRGWGRPLTIPLGLAVHSHSTEHFENPDLDTYIRLERRFSDLLKEATMSPTDKRRLELDFYSRWRSRVKLRRDFVEAVENGALHTYKNKLVYWHGFQTLISDHLECMGFERLHGGHSSTRYEADYPLTGFCEPNDEQRKYMEVRRGNFKVAK